MTITFLILFFASFVFYIVAIRTKAEIAIYLSIGVEITLQNAVFCPRFWPINHFQPSIAKAPVSAINQSDCITTTSAHTECSLGSYACYCDANTVGLLSDDR